jgi:NADH:ubiquinone oxidoreductase subunit E
MLNILRALFAVQAAQGYVAPSAVPHIAAGLGVTDAEVAGVLSFYPDLRTKPAGRHIIRVCMGEGCMANHCRRLVQELEKKLAIHLGESTRDGRFTLEKMYCAGNCAVGPTVMIDQNVHGRVTPTDVAKILAEYQ